MAGPTFHVVTDRDRPGLVYEADGATADLWPEFMLHDSVANRLWPDLYRAFPDYQFALLDAAGEVAAVGNSILLAWDGDLANLPDEGWDWVTQQGITDHEAGRAPTLVSALQIKIARAYQGHGVSHETLRAMRSLAAQAGFTTLVAPVRPSLKSRYPLTPMERYIQWQGNDGLPFDPWLRVHSRAGAQIVRVCARSMQIEGTLAEWEAWTGMRFPESGQYVVEGALVPVEIDRERDIGRYVEPNVWMRHTLNEHAA
jgi:GNAT superfamily N-acetyltransferase